MAYEIKECDNDHKYKIQQSFNRASLTYDEYSYPQQMIGCKFIHLIRQYLSECESIIDLGCGSGIVTEQLAQALKYKQFYAIDIADQLINRAKKRLTSYPVEYFQDDFENLSFKNNLFSLIFSNMALQWSPTLYTTLQYIREFMPSNGLLAFTIPLAGTFSELVSASRNHFYSLETIQLYLMNAGYEPLHCDKQSLTIAFDSWIKALRSIKATGANYLFKRKNKSLSGKGLLSGNGSAHHGQHLTKIKSLSYHVGYFIARKNPHVI